MSTQRKSRSQNGCRAVTRRSSSASFRQVTIDVSLRLIAGDEKQRWRSSNRRSGNGAVRSCAVVAGATRTRELDFTVAVSGQ